LLFFLLSCTSSQKSSTTSEKGQFESIEYDWSLISLKGDPVHFSTYKNEVIFLNIWATWCQPCLKEMPDIQQLQNSMQSEQIKFILASSEDPEIIDTYLQKNQITLPVYRYSSNIPNVLKAEYIPRTYIIDRYGKIVYKKIGQFKWNTQDMKEFLRFLANVKIKE
jgi:thiol-disulfide isomerase/thioredoxin